MSDIIKLSSMEGELAHLFEAIEKDECTCEQRDLQIRALEKRLEDELQEQDAFLNSNSQLCEEFKMMLEKLEDMKIKGYHILRNPSISKKNHHILQLKVQRAVLSKMRIEQEISSQNLIMKDIMTESKKVLDEHPNAFQRCFDHVELLNEKKSALENAQSSNDLLLKELEQARKHHDSLEEKNMEIAQEISEANEILERYKIDTEKIVQLEDEEKLGGGACASLIKEIETAEEESKKISCKMKICEEEILKARVNREQIETKLQQCLKENNEIQNQTEGTKIAFENTELEYQEERQKLAHKKSEVNLMKHKLDSARLQLQKEILQVENNKDQFKSASSKTQDRVEETAKRLAQEKLKFDSLSTELNFFKASVENRTSEVVISEKKLTASKEELALLLDKISATNSEIKHIEADTNIINEKIDRARESITHQLVHELIAKVSISVGKSAAAHQKAMIQTEIDAVNKNVSDIKEALSNVNNEINMVSKAIAEQKEKRAIATQQATKYRAEVLSKHRETVLQAYQQYMNEQLNAVDRKTEEANKRVADLAQTQQAEIREAESTFDASVAADKEKISAIKAELSAAIEAYQEVQLLQEKHSNFNAENLKN